jgi:hypothetical protein
MCALGQQQAQGGLGAAAQVPTRGEEQRSSVSSAVQQRPCHGQVQWHGLLPGGKGYSDTVSVCLVGCCVQCGVLGSVGGPGHGRGALSSSGNWQLWDLGPVEPPP